VSVWRCLRVQTQKRIAFSFNALIAAGLRMYIGARAIDIEEHANIWPGTPKGRPKSVLRRFERTNPV
jgi:hypothetical protein